MGDLATRVLAFEILLTRDLLEIVLGEPASREVG